MSDASDRLQELGDAGVRLLPARELLTVIGELFVELMPVEVDDATADDLARAALMRHALAEVTDRAGKLCPLLSSAACSCGERFATAEELDEHFGAVFVPADDIGLDGKQHAEVARDWPATSHLLCSPVRAICPIYSCRSDAKWGQARRNAIATTSRM